MDYYIDSRLGFANEKDWEDAFGCHFPGQPCWCIGLNEDDLVGIMFSRSKDAEIGIRYLQSKGITPERYLSLPLSE